MSDTSIDSNPQKDPNNYLAPHAGRVGAFRIAAIILVYVIIIILLKKYFK